MKLYLKNACKVNIIILMPAMNKQTRQRDTYT